MAVIDKNKLLGKKKEKKGGALAVIPKSPLVVSTGGELSKIPEKPQEDVVYTIRTKVIEIDKLLKGTLAEEKAQQKKERKQKEVEQRAQKETKLEKPDKDSEEEAPKQLLPKLSFLDGIKKFLGDVLMGWLTFRLIKFLPKIVKLLKPLAAFADFVIDVGGKLLDGLVSFIDWGYKAVEGTKGWIGEKFGEGAAEKFESFMGTLTKVMNLVFAVGLASSAMGLGELFDRKKPRTKPKKPQDFDVDGKPRVKPKPKAKWQVNLQKWWKNTPVGKFLRNAAAIRKKLVRKLQQRSKQIIQNVTEAVNPNKLSKVAKEIIEDPKLIVKAVTENKVVKNVVESKVVQKGIEESKKIITAVQKIDLSQTIQKISDSDLAKKVKSAIPKVDIDAPGFFSKAKANLGSGWNWLKKGAVENFNKTMKAAAEAGAAIQKRWNSITTAASEGFGKLTKAAQEALSKRILQPLLEFLQPVLKPLIAAKDTVLKQLTNIMPTNVLKKVGVNALSDAPKMLGKLGAKALPWIGGLFNILFAYERFANGDTVGGLLESTAAGLDIAGATWPASLSIDLYLFARDMFPDTIMGQENAIIGAIPGAMGMKGKIDGLMKKLPDLGELTKMITGGSKDESIVNAKDGSTETTNMENLLAVDVDAVSKKAENISTEASYEEGTGETVIIKSGSEQDTTGDEESTESLTVVAVGGGGGSDSEVSDLLYKGG